jgi:hypothetical protein
MFLPSLLCQADTPPLATYFFPLNVAVLPFKIFIQDFKIYHKNLYINNHVFIAFIYMWSLQISLCFFYLFFTMAQQPPVGQGLLIIEDSQSHSDTPHSAGLLWTSDQPDADTSTWQHTTLTTDNHPCPCRDSNPQSQQASGRRPTP